ncbi:hypothetical protein Q6D67_18875 [Haliea sp. E1-2-M8]|uniref:hypothetical protein n=1 Tax=Haliea sp. E1-2-M8 TaxID=3064706 RepID=UPI00272303CD|nr:hypothetical protein [Haliea sp. E1-2-M8]MDO8863761.1 hypothetical protein [Haliea sp. E1-2-M8]
MNPLVLTVLGLLLTASPLAVARDWSVDAIAWEDGGIAGTSTLEHENVSRQALQLGYRWDRADPSAYALRYKHQTLRIRQGNPAGNGYLHQLDWRQQTEWQQFQVELTLGVHGTSNMFKYTDFHRDALVATGAIGYRFGSEGTSIGFAGDYRFGSFMLYPQWRTAIALGQSSLQLNLPVAIALQAADGDWQLGFERYGEKWGTLNSDRQIADKLYLHEWRLSGLYRLSLRQGDLALVVGAGMSLHTRVHYLDLDAGTRRERLEDRLYVSLGLRW